MCDSLGIIPGSRTYCITIVSALKSSVLHRQTRQEAVHWQAPTCILLRKITVWLAKPWDAYRFI